MVNSAKLFAMHSGSNSAAKAEVNHTITVADAYMRHSDDKSFTMKQEVFSPISCQIVNAELTEAEDSQNYTNYLSSKSFAKQSPTYMDDDVQFNFPGYQLQNGNTFNSHVVNESVIQQKSEYFGDEENTNVPKMERQYSINTVMEVIDSHDINDTSFCHVPKEYNWQQSNYYTPMFQHSQPILIQRPKKFATNKQSSTVIGNTTQKQSDVFAPPDSDCRNYMRNSPMCGSNASSVEIFPFSTYQNVFVDSPSSFDVNVQVTGTSHGQQNFSDSVGSVFNTLDQTRQANQSAFSPFHSDTSSPAFPPISSNFCQNNNSNLFFTFENILDDPNSTEQFHPVTPQQVNKSCSGNFLRSSSQLDGYPSYPPKTNSNLSASSAETNSFAKNIYNLEEVDNSHFSDDIQFTAAAEQDRADLRRIRNNLACRASRERRKKRKKEKEALVDYLEDKNRHLKERVRLLEEAVLSAHEDVKRRMSQS